MWGLGRLGWRGDGGWDGMGMRGVNLDDFGAVFDMSLIFDKSAHFWEAEFWP